MGITISHKGKIGGPNAENVIDEAIEGFKEEVYREGLGDKLFWRDMLPTLRDVEGVRMFKDKYPVGFKPTRVKEVCVLKHPKAETFCISFIKGEGDEWVEVFGGTKTQYAPQWVHIQTCEMLEKVQKKIQDAGGVFEIYDEGGYCGKDGTRDPKVLNESMEGNAAVINKMFVALSGEDVKQGLVGMPAFIDQKDSSGAETSRDVGGSGTLDNWLALHGKPDFMVWVKAPKKTVPVTV